MTELTLMQKILKITNELSVKKNGKNTFSKYDYFKLEDIQNALNPLLGKYGVFMHYDLTKGEADVYRGTLTLFDADNRENFVTYVADIEKAEVKGASGIQMSGATITYGKRQAVMNAFNLSEDDDDPDNDRNDKTNPKNLKKPDKAQVAQDSDPVAEMLKVFAPLKVTQADLEKKFGKPMAEFGEVDFSECRTIYSDLKKQKKTKEEVFG